MDRVLYVGTVWIINQTSQERRAKLMAPRGHHPVPLEPAPLPTQDRAGPSATSYPPLAGAAPGAEITRHRKVGIREGVMRCLPRKIWIDTGKALLGFCGLGGYYMRGLRDGRLEMDFSDIYVSAEVTSWLVHYY
jgi:hypothetical protein